MQKNGKSLTDEEKSRFLQVIVNKEKKISAKLEQQPQEDMM
jgi:hypothetical protein